MNPDGRRSGGNGVPCFHGKIVTPDKRSADPGSTVPPASMDAGALAGMTRLLLSPFIRGGEAASV